MSLNAKHRESSDEGLDTRLAFERLVTAVASSLINLPSKDIDRGIRGTLKLIGKFAEVDRSYIFLTSQDGSSASMTHEWHSSEVESLQNLYQNIPISDDYRWLVVRLARGESFVAPHLTSLPVEAKALARQLKAHGTTSIALVPLVYAGKLFGALGFSIVNERAPWNEASHSLLKVVGELLVSALQRGRAEDALRESETRFSGLIDGLGEGILYCDRNDIILHVNARMCELAGRSAEEMIGAQAYELLLPQGEASFLIERTKRRLTGISEAYEIALMRKDGRRFWAEINATPIRESSGKIVGTLGAITDITHRKQADEDLRASEKKYRDLVETSGDLIWSLDLKGRFTFVNSACKRVYGYDAEEMLGKTFTHFQTPDQAKRKKKMFDAVLAGKAQFHFESIELRKDGSQAILNINALAISDNTGKVIGVSGTASDISERFLTEQELRHQKDFLRLIIDTNPNLIFAKDYEGRFVLVNKSVADIYGTTTADLVGKTDADFNSNLAEVEHFRRDDQAVISGGTPRFVPEEPVTDARSKEVRWFQTIKKPLVGPDGKVNQLLGVATDITERKRAGDEAIKLQRQLMQAQKMEAIGQLAAGIAHDLNNALAAVVGHLQLMKMGPPLEGQLGSSVDIALKGCKRATSLIEQLLGFSRQGKYNLQSVSLQRAVTETVEFLGRIVGTDLDIANTGETQELIILADQAQLQQALTNLIINAKHAMPSGGTIRFDFSRRRVSNPQRFNSKAKAGEYAVLKVIDTGSGISPENIDKVFEPFFTTKGSEHGTGLGLSMVYGIVQNHFGWIDAESEVGVGTTFTLYFPTIHERARTQETTTELSLASGSGLVMVVDDEPFLVELAQEFLHKAGYQAQGFTDPRTALDWYRENYRSVDLIVLDMKMPRMDGRSFFDQAMRINKNSRVVILSGYIQDDAAQEILERGALHFFHKPLKYPELLDWISRNIQKPA